MNIITKLNELITKNFNKFLIVNKHQKKKRVFVILNKDKKMPKYTVIKRVFVL